jgi:chaperonin GroES
MADMTAMAAQTAPELNYLAPMAQQPAQPHPAMQALGQIMGSANLAAEMDGDKLSDIAQRVVREYEIDRSSREDWEKRTAAALDLAMMVSEEKSYPFQNASNVKFPLLTTAALQFNARAYPAIVQGNRVAKCITWGADPQGLKAARADRVGEHLSYQLLSELPEWEEDTDKLLLMLPIVGCVFRKVYWDPSVKRNVTRLVTADRLVVNYHARSLDDVPRTTEKMFLYPYEIQERIRDKRFVDFDYGAAQASEDNDDKKEQPEGDDDDAPHLFLEQHRLLDLDEDGYSEPYIVTVHHTSQKVCRIVANFDQKSVTMADDGTISAIRKNSYYVKYQFLPSPDNGFYGWGFGWLLKDIGEGINTTFNLMFDAGHLANIQGGLISSVLGIKEKSIKLKMGEWRVVNTSAPLNQAMMPIKYDGPSAVLFNLLGMLVEAGKEVASIKDVLTGDTPATAPVGTTLAVIEQGLQVFTSIYKRIHRALKAELGLHAKLNRDHPNQQRYQAFFDADPNQPPPDQVKDYSEDDMDILPISDPSMVSRMQQIAKAQLLQGWAKENPVANQIEVSRRILEAAQIEDIEELIQPPPPPNPEEEILKRAVAMRAIKKQDSEILKDETAALLNIANAEAAEAGSQVSQYEAVMAGMEGSDGQGGSAPVEGSPGDAMGAQPMQGPGNSMGGGDQGAPVPVGPAPSGMGGAAGPGLVPQGAG